MLPTEWQLSIERSKPMLEWADDWDDNGTKAFEQGTWDRVMRVLQALWDCARMKELIPAPDIGPCSGGSIDLHWCFPGRELLINVPEDPNEACGYYGDNNGPIDALADRIKGELFEHDTNQLDLIWQWLLQPASIEATTLKIAV